MYIGQVQYSWSFGCLISKMEIATKNDGVQWRNEKRSSMAVFNKLGELTKHIQQIHPTSFNCTYCYGCFANLDDLFHHMKVVEMMSKKALRSNDATKDNRGSKKSNWVERFLVTEEWTNEIQISQLLCQKGNLVALNAHTNLIEKGTQIKLVRLRKKF